MWITYEAEGLRVTYACLLVFASGSVPTQHPADIPTACRPAISVMSALPADERGYSPVDGSRIHVVHALRPAFVIYFMLEVGRRPMGKALSILR